MPAGFLGLKGRFEFVEQLALASREVDRRFDDRATQQVAGVAAAHRFDALAAQAEHLATLGFRRILISSSSLRVGTRTLSPKAAWEIRIGTPQ